MLKKQFLLSFFICLYALAVQAQKEENVWLCGINTGLDFNAGSPPDSIGAPGRFKASESVATYCDPNTGELLFYTDGDTVWNRNGAIMPNGAKLTDLFTYPGVAAANPTSSTAQGSLIMPMPDYPEKYYIFSLTQFTYYAYMLTKPGSPDKSGFLYYSVVDMSLDGGLGDVVAGQKGIPVDTVSNFSEHMIGVAGNQCNAWVILMDPQKATTMINQFKAFEVTANGVDTTPVVSSVFTSIQQLKPYSQAIQMLVGKMSISPNRQKLAVTILDGNSKQRLSLFDFDPNTGLISNPMLLDTAYLTEATTKYYGVAFSPDNTKLYAATWTGTQAQSLFQFDVSSNNANTIIGTRTKVATTWSFSDVKRGPDGKIYYLSSYSAGTLRIGAINFPNLSGSASQRDSVAVQLAAASSPGQGFPNAVPVLTATDTAYAAVDTAMCPNSNIVLRVPPGAAGYVWNNGDTAQMQVISQAGTYWVFYKGDPCHRHVDTFHVQLIPFNPPSITVNTFDLGTTLTYDSYHWMLNGDTIPGATGSIYTVTENGDYQVIVSRNGCTDTSAIYKVTNVGLHDVHPAAAQVSVYPNPAHDRIHISAPIRVNATLTGIDGRVIRQENNAVRVSVGELAAGMYLLRITDQEGTLIKVEKVVKPAK